MKILPCSKVDILCVLSVIVLFIILYPFFILLGDLAQ